MDAFHLIILERILQGNIKQIFDKVISDIYSVQLSDKYHLARLNKCDVRYHRVEYLLYHPRKNIISAVKVKKKNTVCCLNTIEFIQKFGTMTIITELFLPWVVIRYRIT